MKIPFAPKTTLGKWSVALMVAFIVLLAIFQILVASGQRGGETFFSNLILTIPMLIAGVSGISAFVTGLIGIIKNKERSVIVYLAALIGLFVLFFWIGEIVFPH